MVPKRSYSRDDRRSDFECDDFLGKKKQQPIEADDPEASQRQKPTILELVHVPVPMGAPRLEGGKWRNSSLGALRSWRFARHQVIWMSVYFAATAYRCGKVHK